MKTVENLFINHIPPTVNSWTLFYCRALELDKLWSDFQNDSNNSKMIICVNAVT